MPVLTQKLIERKVKLLLSRSTVVAPQHFLQRNRRVFETSSRPYLPNYGAHCHPDVIVR